MKTRTRLELPGYPCISVEVAPLLRQALLQKKINVPGCPGQSDPSLEKMRYVEANPNRASVPRTTQVHVHPMLRTRGLTTPLTHHDEWSEGHL